LDAEGSREEAGKRSEMAEMRSEVPRHAEETLKMEGQRRVNENFASKEATLLAGTDSAEAKEESGKQYDWMKRRGESEASYEKRLGLMKKKDTNSKEKAMTKPKVVEAKDAEAGKAAKPPATTDAGKQPQESVTAGSGKSAMNQDVIGTTEPPADPNSMTIQDDHVDTGKSALAKETADREMRSYIFYQKSWAVNCCMDCYWVCSDCSGLCDHFDQSST
jgi:hypothetical protein